MMKLKYFLLVPLFLNVTSGAYAQYDSIVNRMQKEFDAFKKGIEQEHRQFKARNDSIFSAFLKDSWESFHVFFKSRPEEKPKPVVQPVAPMSPIPQIFPQRIMPPDSVKGGNIPDTLKMDIKAPKAEPEYEKTGAVPFSLEFYGSSPPLFLPSELPHTAQLTGSEIARFFDVVAPSVQVSQLLLQLSALKENLRLNDWGYYKLAEAASGKIYDSPKEQILLTWILMLKSGYNVKIGYSSDQVFLMIPSIQELFNSWYLNINNVVYYIVSKKAGEDNFPELTVHKADYPGNNALSMRLGHLPVLGNKAINKTLNFRDKTFTIPVNQNLISFYEDYPLCNMEVYFSAPLSDGVKRSVESFLKPLLSDLTPDQKVAVLLEFVQRSFAYKTDKEQFGREKFFFPDEMFYYPYSDCEDRSVLFSWLVRHFTGLRSIGLEYPGHVNTAILFPGNVSGTKVASGEEQFIVCDPTYRNAPIGYLATEYKDMIPRIINFE